MNQETKTQNQTNAAGISAGTAGISNRIYLNLYGFNGLLFKNQDKNPPGRWRSPESHLRMNPDWNPNRQWQQNKL